MKIAAAQIKSFQCNTEANMHLHLTMIKAAADQKVSLILFPEMSLTGYERALAADLSFTTNDERLAIFKEKSKEYQMYIIVGAPIQINKELHIGSFVISPNGEMEIYTKQFLHTGEEIYFTPNLEFNPLILVDTQKISMAICADITNPTHAENASRKNTSLYLASIFYTPTGIDEGYRILSHYAKKYQMNVLMSNYIGNAFNLEGAGMSAYWNSKGELVSHLINKEEQLLIIEI